MRALIIIKPGFLQHEKEIVRLLEKNAKVKLTNRKDMVLTSDLMEKHYAEHIGKPFYGELVNYMTSGPVVVFIAEGKDSNTVERVRTVVGANRNPASGTIRELFGIGDLTKTVVHASDSEISGEREISIFYDELVNEK